MMTSLMCRRQSCDVVAIVRYYGPINDISLFESSAFGLVAAPVGYRPRSLTSVLSFVLCSVLGHGCGT